MAWLLLANTFEIGDTGFTTILFVVFALILGLYLFGNAHRSKKGRADLLQDKYRVLSEEILREVPDDELVDAVISNLMAKLDKRKPDAYKTVSILSRGRSAVYSVWLTCKEIENDSLYNYLRSPSGQFAVLAADGLELMGAIECSEAIRSAVTGELFDEERVHLIEEKFKKAVQQENPLEACREYIRTNPEEFVDIETNADQTNLTDTFAE